VGRAERNPPQPHIHHKQHKLGRERNGSKDKKMVGFAIDLSTLRSLSIVQLLSGISGLPNHIIKNPLIPLIRCTRGKIAQQAALVQLINGING